MKISELEKLKFKKFLKDADDILNVLCDQKIYETDIKIIEIVFKSLLVKLKSLIKI